MEQPPYDHELSPPSFQPIPIVIQDEKAILKAKLQTWLGEDFDILKELGSGAGGKVFLCKYLGENENIKKICDEQNLIAVKIPNAHIDIDKECQVIDFLKDKAITGLNIGQAVKHEEQYKAILLQYISYKFLMSELKADSVHSFLRNFYIDIVAQNLSRNHYDDNILKVLTSDLGIIFAQLINEMQSCQFKLHDLRLLHLDTGSRNFLLQAPQIDGMGNFLKFPLVLCDYGHTDMMQQNGTVDVSQVPRKPSTSRDAFAVNNEVATIKTDIFALKCSLIGMVSIAIANLEFDTSILNIGQSDMTNFKNLRKFIPCFQNDSFILTAYLKNLCDHIKNCPDQNIKEQAQIFIKMYSSYICTMPDNIEDFRAVDDYDRKLLLNANIEFFKYIIHQRVNGLHMVENNEKFESFLLTIKRLLSLPVTEDFKNSKLFKDCCALTDVNMAKAFAKEYFNPMQVLNMPTLDIKFPLAGEPMHLFWIISVNKQRTKWLEHLPTDLDTTDIQEEFNQRTWKLISFISQGKYDSTAPISQILYKILQDANNRLTELRSTSSQENSEEEKKTPSPNSKDLEGYDQQLTRSNISKNK